MHQFITKFFNFLSIIIVFFLLYITFLQFYYNSNLLIHPDLFINYQGGFIRRGLDGHILYLISDIFQISFIKTAQVYQLITFIVFIVFIVLFNIKRNIPFYIIFSMSGLLLYLIYLQLGVRKDHIVMLFIIAISVFFSKKNHLEKFWNKILFIFLTLIGTLIHEIFFILIIFPTLLGFWILSNHKLKFYRYLYLIAPSLLVFLLLVTYFWGNTYQIEVVINSYQNLDYNLGYLRNLFTKTFYFWDQNYNSKNILLFFIMFFMHGLFVMTSVYSILNNLIQKKYFLILLFFQSITLILLCMIAVDYARMVFLCFFTVIIFGVQYNFNNDYQQNNFQKLDFLLKKTKYLPFLLYFVVGMPHSYWNGIQSIKKSNLLTQMIEKIKK